MGNTALGDTTLVQPLSLAGGWAWGTVTHRGVHFADGVLEHLHVLHVKAFLEFLWGQRSWGSGPGSSGPWESCWLAGCCLPGAGAPHLREGLVDFHGVQAAGAEPLLALLLLILLHGLLNAQLGAATHTLLEGLQLVVEALHVLAVSCLWGAGDGRRSLGRMGSTQDPPAAGSQKCRGGQASPLPLSSTRPLTQAQLRDTAGPAPDHRNEASITGTFGSSVHVKVMFVLHYSLLTAQSHYV